MREFRKFHVAVLQRRLRNVQKKRDSRAKWLFCQYNPIAFLPLSSPSPSSLLKFSIVVSQKFCCHGSVTSHFSSIRFRAQAIVTSLSRDIYSDRPKNNIIINLVYE